MSVVSERTARGRLPLQPRPYSSNRMGRQITSGGGMSSRSVAGSNMEMEPFLVPPFSAAAAEGVKIDMRDGQDNWAENTTVITANTSEHSYSGLPERNYAPPPTNIGRAVARRCSCLCWTLFTLAISLISLASAPLMAVVPPVLERVQGWTGHEWPVSTCAVDCQGQLLNMAGKVALLALALCIMYRRRISADLPRLALSRTAFLFFILFILIAFWLFYAVRVVLERSATYSYTVSYAISLVDVLLFIHCIWIFFELRQFRSVIYTVTIVRDPDGESRTFQIGHTSIQEAAVHVLTLYQSHFSAYNPFLDYARRSAQGIIGGGAGAGMGGHGSARYRPGYGGHLAAPGFKLYDIEGRGEGNTLSEASARILVEAASRRRMTGHNELFYEELEWEKRFKKRKYRLVSCAEEVFAHVQAVNANNASHKVEPMDPSSAAKAVLGGMAKPLNRFLKFVRQQPNHPPKQVQDHLEQCLAYGFSARTFLQRFFTNYRVAPHMGAHGESKWSLLCSTQVSGPLRHGISFVLRSHSTNDFEDAGIQLLCHFSRFPHFNITEQATPSKSKYELKVTSDLDFHRR